MVELDEMALHAESCLVCRDGGHTQEAGGLPAVQAELPTWQLIDALHPHRGIDRDLFMAGLRWWNQAGAILVSKASPQLSGWLGLHGKRHSCP